MELLHLSFLLARLCGFKGCFLEQLSCVLGLRLKKKILKKVAFTPLITSNMLVIYSRCQANKHLERGSWKDKHTSNKHCLKNIQSIPSNTSSSIYIKICSLVFKEIISYHLFIYSLRSAYNIIKKNCTKKIINICDLFLLQKELKNVHYTKFICKQY